MSQSSLSTNFEAFSKRLLDDDMGSSVLMVENPLELSSKKAAQIVDRLLTRAFNEGRGEDMIQEIVRRVHKIKSWVAEDAGHLEFVRELDRASMSPALRLFNLQAKADGENVMLADHTGTAYEYDHLTEDEAKHAKMLAEMKPTGPKM